MHFPLYISSLNYPGPALFFLCPVLGNMEKSIYLSGSVSYNFQLTSSFPIFPNLSHCLNHQDLSHLLVLSRCFSATMTFSSFSLAQSTDHSSKSSTNASFFKELITIFLTPANGISNFPTPQSPSICVYSHYNYHTVFRIWISLVLIIHG